MAAGRIPGLNSPPVMMSNYLNMEQLSNNQMAIPSQINNQLNESSELEEIVINHKKNGPSMNGYSSNSLPVTPLIFPSGIQRQNIASSANAKY